MSDDVRYEGYYACQGSGPEPGGPSITVDELLDALDLIDAVFAEES